MSTKITFQVQAQLVWQVAETAHGTVVGVCDPLGLTLEADDRDELASMIEEGLHFLMMDLFEDGELHRFLQDRGWTPNQPIPHRLPEGGVKFDVPFRVESSAPVHGHA